METLTINLKGNKPNPMSLVGKFMLTDGMFKLSKADAIEISNGEETILLVNQWFRPGEDDAFNQYVKEMADKGWRWTASYEYMVFRKID